MLTTLTPQQVQLITVLAKAVRTRRDHILGNVAEADLSEFTAARGEHNPTAALGFDPVSSDAAPVAALHDAIGTLSSEARAELYALMRVGQGDLAARTWHRGIVDAERLGDDAVMGSLVEDADLHVHLTKGLYETGQGG